MQVSFYRQDGANNLVVMDRVEEAAVPAQEEQYNSEEDEDFDPATLDAQDEGELSASTDDDDDDDEEARPSTDPPAKARKGSKKRKQPHTEPDLDLDSGDEATIKQVEKKKKRRKNDDQDSGGEGGLIKTRAQRAAE